MEVLELPRTTALTIRLPKDIIKDIEKYADTLRLRPSSLVALVVEEKLDEWVQEYAERIYKEVNQ